MKLTFSIADTADAPALAALHTAAAENLSRLFGTGVWSSPATERGVLFGMRHARVIVARQGKRIVGSMRLQTKKPWAIDVAYFTPVKKAIYLTAMAVIPTMQRKGIGSALPKRRPARCVRGQPMRSGWMPSTRQPEQAHSMPVRLH
jgi:hypothetical protein